MSLMQSTFGFHPKFVQAIVAAMEEDIPTLIETMQSLSQILNIRSKVASYFTEILYEMRKMQKRAAEQLPGRAIVLLKLLFKTLFSDFPSFSLANMLKFTILGKVRIVVKMLERIEGFPLSPLQILAEFKNQRVFRMKRRIVDFTRKVLPQEAYEVVEAFVSVYKGEALQNYNFIAKTLGFEKKPFKLKMLVSAITKNVYLAREGMVDAVKFLSEKSSISRESAEQVRGHLLGLVNMFHGEQIQITFVYRKVKPLHQVNISSLRTFQSLLQGSRSELHNACIVLGIQAKVAMILELQKLYQQAVSFKLEIPELLKALNLTKEHSKLALSLVHLLSNIPLVRLYQKEEKQIAVHVDGAHEQHPGTTQNPIKEVANELVAACHSLYALPVFKKSAQKANSILISGQSDQENAKELLNRVLYQDEEKAVEEIKRILNPMLPSPTWRTLQVFSRAKLYVQNESTVVKRLILLEKEFMKEFSEIIDAPVEEASLVLDILTKDASKVFGMKSEEEQEEKSEQEELEEMKEEINPRSQLLAKLLHVDHNTVVEIARNWLIQETLIEQGKKGLNTLFKIMRVPSSFRGLISHLRSSEFKTKEEEEKKFKEWVARVVRETFELELEQRLEAELNDRNISQHRHNFLSTCLCTIVDLKDSKVAAFAKLGFKRTTGQLISNLSKFLQGDNVRTLFKIFESVVANHNPSLANLRQMKEESQLQNLILIHFGFLTILPRVISARNERESTFFGKIWDSLFDMVKSRGLHKHFKHSAYDTPSNAEELLLFLFESGFFNEFARIIASTLDVKQLHPKIERILHTLIAYALKSKPLLHKLIHRILTKGEPHLKDRLLIGFTDIIKESQESSNAFVRFVHLDPGLVQNLIKLKSTQAKSITEAVQYLSKKAEKESESTLIASVISILKGDLNELPSFVSELGLSPSNCALATLVCPLGDLSQVQFQLTYLASMLEIKDWKTMKLVLELCQGQVANLWRLTHMNPKQFNLGDVRLAQSVLSLTQIGSSACPRKWFQSKAKDAFRRDIIILANYIIKNIKKEEKKREAKSQEDFIGLRFHDESMTRDFEAEAQFTDDLQLLVEAVWGEESALQELARRVSGYMHAQDVLIAEKKKELKELFIKVRNEVDEVEYQRKVKLDSNVKKAQAEVKDFARCKLTQQVDNLNDPRTEKVALQVGCTFFYVEFKPISQPRYSCRTCNQKNNEYLVLCGPCATKCHKGHEVVVENEGRPAMMWCDCGAGNFKRLNQVSCFYDQELFQIKSNTFLEIKIKKEKYNRQLEDLIEQESEEESKEMMNFEESSSSDQDEQVFLKVKSKPKPQQRSSSRFVPKASPSETLIETIEQCLNIPFTESDHALTQGDWDLHLKRHVSFIENVIHLAQGKPLSSFLLHLLNPSIPEIQNFQQSIEQHHTLTYNSLQTLLALVQGDREKLLRHGAGLAETLEIGEVQEYSPLQKLEGLMSLVKGVKSIDAINKLDTEEEAWIFKKVFGSNWRKGLALHSLLVLSPSDLLSGIAQDNLVGEGIMNYKSSKSLAIHTLFNEDFLKGSLDLHEADREWCGALVRLAFKDKSAFDIVGPHLAPSNLFEKYKGVIEPTAENVAPLLNAFVNIPNKQAAQALFALKTGDFSSFLKFLIFRSLPSLDSEKQKQLQQLMLGLEELISQKAYKNQTSIDKVFDFFLINPLSSLGRGLLGLSGTLSNNMIHILDLVSMKQEEAHKSRAVIKLCQGIESQQDIRLILDQIIDKEGGWEPTDKDFKLIKHALHGLNGEVHELALFVDAFLFDSQKCTAQFLTSIATSRVKQVGQNHETAQLRAKKILTESLSWMSSNFEPTSSHAEYENISQYFTTAISMNFDYITLLFEPLEMLKPKSFPRELFRDFIKLIHPHKGFPNMQDLLSAVSPVQKVQIKVFPSFFIAEDKLSFSDIEELQRKIGFPRETMWRLLGYRVINESTIEVNLHGLMHTIFGLIDVKLENMKLFIAILFALFKQSPLVLRVLETTLHIMRGDKDAAYQLFSPLIKLFIHMENLDSPNLDSTLVIDSSLLDGVGTWLKAILTYTNTLRIPSSQEIKKLAKEMIESWFRYLEVTNFEEEMATNTSSYETVGSLLTGAVSLVNGNLEGLAQFAQYFGSFDPQVAQALGSILKGKSNLFNTKIEAVSDKLDSNDESELEPRVLFSKFDKDKSGAINFNQFCDLTKYMGLFVPEQQLRQLFTEADTNGSNEIDYSEFEAVLDTIKAQITHTAVRMVGATQSDLITALVMSVIFLLLLFVFIFVGISVFSATSTLSTIIDSTLPALAGVGLALRKKDKSKLLKSLEKIVKKLIKAITL